MQGGEISALRSVKVLSHEGEMRELEEELLLEYKLDIYVNGNLAEQCFCTPVDLENLVIGRLFAEGVISSIQEVAACVVDEEEHSARVVLKETDKVCKKRTQDLDWKPEWIFKLAEDFAKDTILHKRTSCAHSCFLARRDEMVYAAEDIGRHNAIDKVIGWAVRHEIELEECILYTSGRVPVNMVHKAARANIPLIISKAVATEDAVVCAEEHRISLIGETKTKHMMVYTDFRKMTENREYKNITLEEAVRRIRSRTKPLSPVRLPLKEAWGEVLCGDITAMHDQPPFPRSPLDGYAVCGKDTKGASRENPVKLKVIDKFCAGEYRKIEVHQGECIRIMTGAVIPKGADAVIRQEDTDYGVQEVQLYQEVSPWQNYCYQGEDYQKGDVLLHAGTELDFVAAAVLASNGIAEASVYPKPRVVVLATGDELTEPGIPLAEGKIYNANLYMVKTRLREWGIESETFHVEDKMEIVKHKIMDALKNADAVITTGGVSVGEKDILNRVLYEPEMELVFDGVVMKPGSPVKYALCQGKPILALSGNPFAALVTLELFGRAMADSLMNRKQKNRRTTAVLENEFTKPSKVRRLVRAVYENGRVRAAQGHSSGQLFSMMGCNCLVDIPKGTKGLSAGSVVEVILL